MLNPNHRSPSPFLVSKKNSTYSNWLTFQEKSYVEKIFEELCFFFQENLDNIVITYHQAPVVNLGKYN